MRLLLTADLHFNHARSYPLAVEVIDQMNRAGGDAVVVIGDAAVADGDALEQCLSRFTFAGPKLFVAGNHELWTLRGDSYAIFRKELPRRVRALGWQWLEDEPLLAGDVAIVGSVGWYDFSYAQASLGIPKRFYEAKISPGAAAYLGGYEALLADADDLPPHARAVVARWNDGKFITLGRSDEAFLAELLARLDAQLAALAHVPKVVAAVHHLPFRALLPPPHSAQWDFAKAYLGSDAIGDVLLRYSNVRHAYCGHSHFPATAQVGHVRAVNIGSGYRSKRFEVLEA
ncbi:MAG TPA: metallophosphoesterase [Tepidisphaeraceae bacterium]|nr:metallophosphoesterase [Tepidisphaeraceae bacterium]